MGHVGRFASIAVFAAVASGAAGAGTGEWTTGQHGEREYRLYVPAAYSNKQQAPLVVMLHGCTQSAEAFAESTRMNELAEKEGFLALYPVQKLSANPTRCWNWFQPKNQARGSGEPAEIVGMVEQVGTDHAVDRKRVYVAGLSAGASMSAILASCYPDVFAAAAIHDGTMFKSATNLLEAQKVMKTARTPDPLQTGTEAWACGGKRKLAVPAIVWHGQGDNIVDRRNADRIVSQLVALNDLADDGTRNASIREQPSAQRDQKEGRYSYTVSAYGPPGRPLIEYYKVDKLGHAWSGGKDDLLFSDAKGPDASSMTWEFFKRHSR